MMAALGEDVRKGGWNGTWALRLSLLPIAVGALYENNESV